MITKWKHNNKEIEVLDSIMGSGKTVGIIDWMNNQPTERFIYVSPLLSEVEDRIPQSCPLLDFVSPNTDTHDTKSDHLLELLQTGVNVAITHSLFTDISHNHLTAIDDNDYVLIIDEEIDFIEQYSGKDYSDTDIITLESSGHIRVNEDNLGRVEWTWNSDKFIEGSTYTKLKRMCDLEMLHCSKRDRAMMVLHLPISLVTVTKRTIVMTYLFKGSIMSKFMQMKGIGVKKFNEFDLLKSETQVKQNAKMLITHYTTPSVDKVKKLNLTATWYKHASKDNLRKVESAIRSACRKGSGCFTDVCYTLPKEMVIPAKINRKPHIVIKAYSPSDCFLYCGTKATNQYSHKRVMVHAFNRHPMQSVSSYLQDYGFPILADEFALSECIQWVWRSSIRKDEPIMLCFLSPRMEKLFNYWLDEQ